MKAPSFEFDERPMTSAIVNPQQQITAKDKLQKKEKELQMLNRQMEEQRMKSTMTKQGSAIRGKKIDIKILDSWGDQFYVGLTSLEIIGKIFFNMLR